MPEDRRGVSLFSFGGSVPTPVQIISGGVAGKVLGTKGSHTDA